VAAKNMYFLHALKHNIIIAGEVLYRRFERGSSFPEFPILLYLADYLDVSIDCLVGRSIRRDGSSAIIFAKE
jgi:hypothetical protein